MLVILLALSLAVGVSLAACGDGHEGSETVTQGNLTAQVTWESSRRNDTVYASLTLTARIPGAMGAPDELVTLHCVGTLTPIRTPSPTPTPTPGTIDDKLAMYGVKLTENWLDEHKDSVFVAVQLVGDAFARARKIGETSASAFKAVYGKVHIGWGNCSECLGNGGYTYGYQSKGDYYLIRFVSLSDPGLYANYKLRQVNNVIHELGHLFNHVMDRAPENLLTNDTDPYKEGYNELLVRGTDRNFHYGFASSLNERVWVQNPSNLPTEVFADQFLGWVCNKWEIDSKGNLTDAGAARSDWMIKNMTEWLKP